MDDQSERAASVQQRGMVEDSPASSCSCSIAFLRYSSAAPRQILIAVLFTLVDGIRPAQVRKLPVNSIEVNVIGLLLIM